MTIKDKLSHLRAISIEKLFDDILKENSTEILDYNRDQMYEEGVMDVSVPGYKDKYSPSTIRAKKKAKFNKTDFITLKWTGDFHESLKLLIFKDTFVISSTSLIWAKYLSKNHRFMNPLGLTEKSKEKLRNIARDEIIKKIRDVI